MNVPVLDKDTEKIGRIKNFRRGSRFSTLLLYTIANVHTKGSAALVIILKDDASWL